MADSPVAIPSSSRAASVAASQWMVLLQQALLTVLLLASNDRDNKVTLKLEKMSRMHLKVGSASIFTSLSLPIQFEVKILGGIKAYLGSMKYAVSRGYRNSDTVHLRSASQSRTTISFVMGLRS